MKQLEIIELRYISAKHEVIYDALTNMLKSSNASPEPGEIRIYGNASFDTDLAVHIFHDRTKLLDGGSPLGFHLVSFLQHFGLVNHSVWTLFETNEFQKEKI
jgi:hypothetical protein